MLNQLATNVFYDLILVFYRFEEIKAFQGERDGPLNCLILSESIIQ